MSQRKQYKTNSKWNQTSTLLLDEPPLLVLPQLAAKIGLNEAIVLQQINYWLKDKRIKQDNRFQYQGRFWIYNGYPDWQNQFPFWSQKTIARTIRKLEALGLILSRQINSSDRRKWYSIDVARLNSMGTNCPDATPQRVPLLTESTAESDSPPPNKPVRRKHISKRVLENYIEPEIEPTVEDIDWAFQRAEVT